MRRTLFIPILLVLLTVTTQAQEPTLRVFYTGHSFHMFVPARVGQYTKAANIKEYQLAGSQGIGGSRVIQHWDKEADQNAAKKALMQGTVDVFTMAPHVKIPDEGIDHFVELGLKHNAKMRFLVQQSWMPFDSWEKRIANNDDREKTDLAQLRKDQEKWRTQIETQAKALNQKANREAVFVVPAGDAVATLRDQVAAGKVKGITKQAELFTDAIGHGKPPILVLVSYCNYACITGKSPVGLPLDKAIDDDLNKLLQRIAWDTVSAYPMSGVKGK